MIHICSRSMEEVLYYFFRSSVIFEGHTGRKINDLDPIWARLLCQLQPSNPSYLPCFILWFSHIICKSGHAWSLIIDPPTAGRAGAPCYKPWNRCVATWLMTAVYWILHFLPNYDIICRISGIDISLSFHSNLMKFTGNICLTRWNNMLFVKVVCKISMPHRPKKICETCQIRGFHTSRERMTHAYIERDGLKFGMLLCSD